MDTSKNLWPDFDAKEESTTPPVTILARQAKHLGAKTKNIVVAEVKRTSIPRPPMDPYGLDENDSFAYNFLLVAPVLNYKYNLFTIEHWISFYPLTIYYKGKNYKINDEQELVNKLLEIFNDPDTSRIIQSLLVQSQYSN